MIPVSNANSKSDSNSVQIHRSAVPLCYAAALVISLRDSRVICFVATSECALVSWRCNAHTKKKEEKKKELSLSVSLLSLLLSLVLLIVVVFFVVLFFSSSSYCEDNIETELIGPSPLPEIGGGGGGGGGGRAKDTVGDVLSCGESSDVTCSW